MNVPILYTGAHVDESGNLTPEASQQFDQLFSQMQSNLSDEGYMIPAQKSEVIDSLNNEKSKTALLYNDTHHEFNGNVAGLFKTIPAVTYDKDSKQVTFTVNGETVILQGI